MSTPITDAEAALACEFTGDSEAVPAQFARCLEADRAALMEALERLVGHRECPRAIALAQSAIMTARANFPSN